MGRGRLIAMLAVAVVLLVGVGGVLLYDGGRSDRIAEGVQVAGVDVGGRTAAQARRIVRERVAQPARRDVEVRHADASFVLTAEEAGVELDVERTVQAAVGRSRGGNPWSRTWRGLTGGRVEADVAPRLSFDREAVGAFVKEVGDELDHRAQDADIDPRGGELTVIEESTGFRTDRERLLRRVTDALERPHAQREVEVPGERLEPDVTTDQLAESLPLFLTIDREDFRLRVYEELDHDETYRISVGQAGHHTPAGRYDISTKAVDPAWHVPDEPWAGERRGEVIPPGPENPIKARWLGIEDGIGIHGTDETDSIGERASHGCIRMLIPQVKELYDRVPVGTPVYID